MIVAQFRRVNLAKALVLAFSICFLLLCYSNVDGLIARYNIGRYQAGTLDSVDLEALYATPGSLRRPMSRSSTRRRTPRPCALRSATIGAVLGSTTSRSTNRIWSIF